MARVYVDLDDVLSQTVRGLLALLESLHGRQLPEEAVRHFDLGRSFGLAPAELEAFMQAAHRPEVLARLEPNPGAAQALGAWLDDGHDVFVVTGRPPSAVQDSLRWLEAHEMPHSGLLCVDKYGRQDPGGSPQQALPLEAVAELGFALAVEDSLAMAVHLVEGCGVPVALLDRPWNRETASLSRRSAEGIVRCGDWAELATRFPRP